MLIYQTGVAFPEEMDQIAGATWPWMGISAGVWEMAIELSMKSRWVSSASEISFSISEITSEEELFIIISRLVFL